MKLRYFISAIVLTLAVSSCTAKGMEDVLQDDDVDVVDIENHSVKLYNQVVYDDADYSYSLVANYCNQLTKPDSYLPIGKEIYNPTYGSVKCRLKLFREDSEQCIRDIIVEPQVNSVELTNLLPNVAYRCELWSDDGAAMMDCDRFRTVGKTRMLKIPALKQIDSTTIYNKGYGYILNVRDIGGLETNDGRIIRYDKIIRGGTLHSGNAVYVSEEGKNELITLGVSAELDLRESDKSRSVLGDNIEYESFAVDQLFYRLNIFIDVRSRITMFSSAIRTLLKWLREGKTVYVHCEGGADRTGAFCTIIEGLCGVTENELCHDYEMTSFWQLRDRSREYYTKANDAKYDGDYKFAMAYIKGLLEYNGKVYVKYNGGYYETDKPVLNYTPQPIDDPELIDNLDNTPPISLKDKFRLLMQIGDNGLTIAEMDELEYLLLETRADKITTSAFSIRNDRRISKMRYGLDGRVVPLFNTARRLYIQSGRKYFSK